MRILTQTFIVDLFFSYSRMQKFSYFHFYLNMSAIENIVISMENATERRKHITKQFESKTFI